MRFVGLSVVIVATVAGAQVPTVGVRQVDPASAPGYTLFAPNSSTTTYLVDVYGRIVHTWAAANPPGNSVYLLDDGRLLRPARIANPDFNAGGTAGRVELRAWDSSLLWRFDYSSPQVQSHHDVAWLPSGNVLVLAWEKKTAAEAIAAGRNPALISTSSLWFEHIVEIEPIYPTGGTIVWQWHAWDHLIQDFDAGQANYGDPALAPERIDLNFTRAGPAAGAADWLHANAIDYDPVFDQIVLSIHGFSELWVIDHSTTTAEATGSTGGRSGKGGDLLYRWGNPLAYRAGVAADQQMWQQHDARWIPTGLPGAGNMTVFDNGNGRAGGVNWSAVLELVLPTDGNGNYLLSPGPAYGPLAPFWSWNATPPESFYATNISGAHRLGNGNTLVTHGPDGRVLEVTVAGDNVWEYINPDGAPIVAQGTPITVATRTSVFRATRLAVDHPGLGGRSLVPTVPVERYPCAAQPAVLTATKTAARDVWLTWTPPCTTRWLGQAEQSDAGPVGIPMGGHSDGEHIAPMPSAPAVYYWVY